MPASSGASWALFAALALASSSAVTWASLAYARRRRLFDLPGKRRSHTMPTPRGGGIGIVVGVVVSVATFAAWSGAFEARVVGCLLAALAVVALVGWIDDHRGLGAMPRIAAHGLSALLALGVPALAGHMSLPTAQLPMFDLALLVLFVGIVWSINLHNFMDGIDGLLALQTLFVFTVLALLFARAGRIDAATCTALLAGAVAGFVPFNFPRARIFMGDVGSGVLGLLVALVVLWQMSTPSIALTSGLVLCSAFVTDASCTLLSRMLYGRRWYSAHREHLYQWLARNGLSHAQVVMLYMGWNFLVTLPVVCWMNRAPLVALQRPGMTAAVAVYAAAVVVWCVGKRWCLRSAQLRRLHVS